VTPIRYLTGDATAPAGPGPKVIVHVCNDLGKWGKGFVLAISKRWKEPERIYKAAFAAVPSPALGDVQFVPVEPSVIVANLIGQHGVATRTSKTPPVRYDAIREGLAKVAARARALDASVHMPRIGCGLAGGDWAHVEPLIAETLCAANIDVTVYDFDAAGPRVQTSRLVR
jgi:O-acetyl-ADP-ribose deacetylase (regulator of RNase III)